MAAARAYDDGLVGKCCIVTGGTSGIGKATVIALLDRGCNVVFTGRREEEGLKIQNELRLEYPGETTARDESHRVHFHACDHALPTTAESAVAFTLTVFGRIDVLVNNAGIVLRGDVLDTSDEDWNETLNINVTAAWQMIKHVIPHMIAQKCGSIVNNASDWGLVASPMAVAYCVSKAALIQLTKAAALQFATQNIRVNAVAPGDTFVERWTTDGYFRGSGGIRKEEALCDAAELPMGRPATAHEIANSITFLCGNKSSYMTGSVMVVDGGNTAR